MRTESRQTAFRETLLDNILWTKSLLVLASQKPLIMAINRQIVNKNSNDMAKGPF